MRICVCMHTLAHLGIYSFNEELFSIIDTEPKAVTCSDTLTDNVICNASRCGLFELSYIFNIGCCIEGISQFEGVNRAD